MTGAAVTTRPVLFVTNLVPPDRVGAFEALAERLPLELVTFGGRTMHATPDTGMGRRVSEREVAGLAASGRHCAVICGTAGRVALPGALLGARRARVPFVLWASLWAHPRSVAHALSYPLMRAIYRRADAVATYGPHVSEYVSAHGARNVVVAPQAVDNEFWGAPTPPDPDLAGAGFAAVFVGRDVPEKGLHVLREAWARAELDGELVTATGGWGINELRNLYAAADVLVIPSLRHRTFREPWGLVVNEAMNQHTAVIASDEVGAAAGGLVRHERNGLIVPAGDVDALAAALRRAATDVAAREEWARNGVQDVRAYTYDAWADGMVTALSEAGR